MDYTKKIKNGLCFILEAKFQQAPECTSGLQHSTLKHNYCRTYTNYTFGDTFPFNWRIETMDHVGYKLSPCLSQADLAFSWCTYWDWWDMVGVAGSAGMPNTSRVSRYDYCWKTIALCWVIFCFLSCEIICYWGLL